MSNLIYLLSDAYKNMEHNIKQGDIKIYPVFAVIVSIFITANNPTMNLSQESIITTIVIIAVSFVFISTLLYLLLYISAIANRKIIKDLKRLNNVLNDIYILNFSDFE